MGARERLFNVVWKAGGGRHELLGGPHGPGRNFKFLWARTLPLRKLQVARLQGSTSLLPEGCLLTDRVIFEPISNYLLYSFPYLACHRFPFTYLSCH